jgi:hypothetical protein
MAAPWSRHRSRARELRDRHPHAAEMLTLYLALVEVWDAAGQAGWRAESVLPEVVRATEEHGPRQLAETVGTVEAGVLADWLAGEELPPVERYVARATMRGVDAPPYHRGSGPCPECGGPPQLSYRTEVKDPLASGARMLQCARCANEWSFSATVCPSCGEPAKRTVYAEHRGDDQGGGNGGGPRVGRQPSDGALFPHVRIESCQGCLRYLIVIDLGLDPRAVPEVDELTALPLDLYAAEQGLSKITPNLMGI